MKKCISLFLDFDGVLTGMRGSMFDKMDLFLDWYLNTNDVDIVISSSWKHSFSIPELESFFTRKIKIVGKTPDINDGVDRWLEIEQYINDNAIEHFFILDDNPYIFNKIPESVKENNIYYTDSNIGLTTSDVIQISHKINLIRNKIHHGLNDNFELN